jgi:two-component sensor histidine kinase
MKYIVLAILLFCTVDCAVAQHRFSIGTKTICSDSVFLNGQYSTRFYNENIDSLIGVQSDPKAKLVLAYIKSLWLGYNGRVSESVLWLKNSLKYSIILDYLPRIRMLVDLTNNLVTLGNREEALGYIAEADFLALQLKNASAILNVKALYAQINRDLGKLEKAKLILDEGLPYAGSGSWQTQVYFLFSYTTTLNQLAVMKQDTRYGLHAFTIADSLIKREEVKSFSYMYAYLLAERGAALSILKHHTEAIADFEQARQILLLDQPDMAFNQDINLFHEYYNTGDYKSVVKLGERILEQYDQFGSGSHAIRKIEIHATLAKVYEKLRMFEKALDQKNKFIEEQNRQNELRFSKDLEELEKKYETSKIEEGARLTLLEKNESDRIARQKSEQLKWIIIVCVVIGILLLIAVLFAVQFNLAKRRIGQQAGELELKNQALDQAIQDKDFLFKELHHRVKNNIQLIISFMKLQYKYSPAMSLEMFMGEIESRMNAMTLVHEKLYKGQTHESIDLKEYAHDIADYLLDTISQGNIYPEIELTGDEIKIHIDKAIPIGLVLSEAITNSIKHGFNQGITSPRVDVSFNTVDKNLIISIADNGVGFPPGFDPENTNTLGVKAILLLTKQMKAQISWLNRQGAHWKIVIPLDETPGA